MASTTTRPCRAVTESPAFREHSKDPARHRRQDAVFPVGDHGSAAAAAEPTGVDQSRGLALGIWSNNSPAARNP